MIFSKNKAKEVRRMIEVIKHGLKKFKVTCTNCGCEFTYELSDMKPLGGIDCPDCGNHVAHQSFGNNNGNLYYPPNCRGILETKSDS